MDKTASGVETAIIAPSQAKVQPGLIDDCGSASPCEAACNVELTWPEGMRACLGVIFDELSDGIFVIDGKGRFVGANRAACLLTGYGREALLRMRVCDLPVSADPDQSPCDIRSTLGGLDIPSEAWITRNDGSQVCVEFSGRGMAFSGSEYACIVARDATHKTKAKEELHSLKRHAEALMQASGLLAVTVNAAGKIVDVNEAVLRTTGLDREELVGRDFLNALLPKGAGDVQWTLPKGLQISGAGDLRVLEGFLPAKDGRELLVSWRINEAAGAVPNMHLLLGTDLTERHRLERDLSDCQDRHRKLLDISPDAVIVHNEGRILYANSRAAQLLGRASCEELVGEQITCFIHPEEQPLAAARVKMMLDSGETTRLQEFRLLRLDGSQFCAEVRSAPVVLQGRTCIQAVLHDVSQRKAFEEELRKVLHAVENGPSAVVITGEDGRIQYSNLRFAELTGYSKSETNGEPFEKFFSQQNGNGKFKDCMAAFRSREPWDGQFRTYRKDGEIYWVHARLSPMPNETNSVTSYMLTCEDVTARIELEDHLQTSQRLEALGTLAAGVAHDFNNLLTVINGYCDINIDNLDDADPVHRDLLEIRKAGERASSLVSQLLAFSRKQVVAPKVLNLNAVIGDTEKMLKRLIRENVVLEVNCAKTACRILVDLGQLTQVIINLSVNARDAMPEGGRLKIGTEDVQIGAGTPCHCGRLGPGRYAVLTIEDNGCGMSRDTQRHIFEPFFTTKRQGSGTGLGLSMVYGAVTQAGGHIDVRSWLGEGTSMRIYFPMVDSATDESAKPVRLERAVPRGQTVLLVEDDETVRAFCRKTLEQSGYRVFEAQNGNQALEISRQVTGAIHLLVSDLVMPRMGGREAARILCRERPSTKVLFITGYADDETFHLAPQESKGQVLHKPFASNEFMVKIREILDRR